MSKGTKSRPFRDQMAESMAELQSIMSAGQTPTGDGRLTIRTIEVAEAREYDAEAVREVRATLNVSQAVFARLVGVSDVLVRSWERGARAPAPVARRLLDQIRANPAAFARLVRRVPGTPSESPDERPARGGDRRRTIAAAGPAQRRKPVAR